MAKSSSKCKVHGQALACSVALMALLKQTSVVDRTQFQRKTNKKGRVKCDWKSKIFHPNLHSTQLSQFGKVTSTQTLKQSLRAALHWVRHASLPSSPAGRHHLATYHTYRPQQITAAQIPEEINARFDAGILPPVTCTDRVAKMKRIHFQIRVPHSVLSAQGHHMASCLQHFADNFVATCKTN